MASYDAVLAHSAS
ncbi:BnaAnng13120D [Brassica napus]|uniref:BnaAnng13120D protein n=1 Tax=Brassica napus TaxID=3708 RepID=A0A078IYJ0_BRANA|nr:BnaAnng13120D [Brassica napus]